MRKGIFIALVVIATGVAAFMLLYQPKRIAGIWYSQNGHRNWPIMQVSARLNGNRVEFPNTLVRGGGASSYVNDPKHLDFSAEWVEMLPNSGWRADFSIPMETAPLRETRRNQFMLELNIVFGRNGELQLVTGQGEVLLETCGTRVPELDKDYRDQIPLDQRFEWAYEIEDGPPPATNCPDPEE